MISNSFLQLLARDPLKAHLCIVEWHDINTLIQWVRDASRIHGMTLAVKPWRDPDVGKWQAIARTRLRELLDNSSENILKPYLPPIEPKGLREMPFHARRACVCVRKATGVRYYRGPSFPRIDKITDVYNRTALTGLRGQYSAYVRDLAVKGNIEFITPIEWLEQRPELWALWQRSIALRKEVVTV